MPSDIIYDDMNDDDRCRRLSRLLCPSRGSERARCFATSVKRYYFVTRRLLLDLFYAICRVLRYDYFDVVDVEHGRVRKTEAMPRDPMPC